MSSNYALGPGDLADGVTTLQISPIKRKQVPGRAEPVKVNVQEVPASPTADAKTTGNQVLKLSP